MHPSVPFVGARWLLFVMVVLTFSISITAQIENQSSPPQSRRRTVAVTFDDLPAVTTRQSTERFHQITDGLLDILTRHRVPAIGFVNEIRLYPDGTLDSSRVRLLGRWLDAGMDLGNHSYSHGSLYSTGLSAFTDDVLRGETVTRALLSSRNLKLRYFRHPFLNTGPNLATKRAFEEFLTSRGYTIAPVTIDNGEWIFARAYDRALDANDTASAHAIGQAYTSYMGAMIAYYEEQSMAILGYELPQILLVHANRLNARYFGDVLSIFHRRQYSFVSLGEALRDPAYRRDETYTGPAGITWLHRWAISDGKPRGIFLGEPPVPDFIMTQAGVTSQ